MDRVIKVGFEMFLKSKDGRFTKVCSQLYIVHRGEKRNVQFYGRKYLIQYYDHSNENYGVSIEDIEDKSTYVGFHNNVDCQHCLFSLDTWDEELLNVYIMNVGV